MIDIADDDGHVVLALGLYVLGALSEDECREVDEHLAQCNACRVEAAEVGEVPAMLAMLSDDDVRELVAEFGWPGAENATAGVEALLADTFPAGAPADEALSGGAPAAETLAAGTAGAGRTVAESTGPASPLAQPAPPANRSDPARPSAGRPGGRAPRARRRLFGRTPMIVGAVVVALVAGIALGLGLGGGGGAKLPTMVTGATTDRVTGAGLSVELSGDGDTVGVRAKVSGVRAGVTYELYAVDTAGRTYSVSRWLGTDADQIIQGDLHAPAKSVAFFAVTEMGGRVVVTLRFVSGSAVPSGAPTG